MPNEIPAVFHNLSNYQFEDQFECLWKTIEKYQSFSVSIEKEIAKIDKDCNLSVVTVSYKIRFIDSARFMTNSLSNLVDNLAEGIHKVKCKDCDCFLEYESVNNDLIK